MSAAAIRTLRPVTGTDPSDTGSCTITLTAEQRALVATALLTQSVMLFNASSAQEAAGRYEQSSALFHDGYVLSKIELMVRNSKTEA